MEKQVIGTKINWGMARTIMMVLLGIVIIVGAVFLFLFVIGGAIGGGIAGALGASGAMAMMYGISAHRLPHDLVHLDTQAVYFGKHVINLSDIQGVDHRGNSIIITPKHTKRITQGFIRNAAECAESIRGAIQSIQPTDQPADTHLDQ